MNTLNINFFLNFENLYSKYICAKYPKKSNMHKSLRINTEASILHLFKEKFRNS